MITVDTFIGTGVYQTGAGDADFPLSYIASDNVLGGRIAARALAKAIGDKGKVYVSNVKPGHLDHRPARGRLQGGDEGNHPEHQVLETQFNDDDANKAAVAGAGGVRPQSRPRRRVRRQPVLGARRRQRRQAGRPDRQGQGGGVRRADLDRRQPQDRPRRPGDRPASGRDRLLRRGGRLCPPHRPIGPDRDRHRLHRDRPRTTIDDPEGRASSSTQN